MVFWLIFYDSILKSYGLQKLFFLLMGQKKLVKCACGDQLTPEVLFRLRGLDLWPNNPVRERGKIQGLSVKEEMKIVLQKELKGIYSGPKHIRGKHSSRNFCPRWLEVCLCKIGEGEEIRQLRCDHLFHRVCLDRWLGYKRLTCPLCRGSLFPCTTITESGVRVEVLLFKFSSLISGDRETWWLR